MRHDFKPHTSRIESRYTPNMSLQRDEEQKRRDQDLAWRIHFAECAERYGLPGQPPKPPVLELKG